VTGTAAKVPPAYRFRRGRGGQVVGFQATTLYQDKGRVTQEWCSEILLGHSAD